MLISNGICQYKGEICRAKQKYMPFSGPSPSALSGKKFQTTGTYTNDATLRSGFFSRGNGPAFFSQDSRIRVNEVLF